MPNPDALDINTLSISWESPDMYALQDEPCSLVIRDTFLVPDALGIICGTSLGTHLVQDAASSATMRPFTIEMQRPSIWMLKATMKAAL